MKKLLGLLYLISSCYVWSAAPKDIIIKSRFDHDSSGAFIQRLRAFLIHNNFGDPYSQPIKKPIVVDLAQALNEIPEDTQAWIKELQSVLNLKVFESKYSIIIQGLNYKVGDFNPELQASISATNRVEYVTNNFVSGLNLAAEKVIFEVELAKTTSGEPIRFSIEMVKPQFMIHEDLEVELPMVWQTSVSPTNVVLSLQSINLHNVLEKIVKSPERIGFDSEALILPEVSIRVGHKEIKFDKKKILNFFETRKEATKVALLDLIKSKLSGRFTNILETPMNMGIPRTYQINDTIHAVFDLENMNANRAGIINIDIDGHFCPKNDGVVEKFCLNQNVPAKMRREIPQEMSDKSFREINRLLIENRANIAVSVSEHYLNQLIQATIQAGLWERELAGKEFRLGPETAFVISDTKGENFSLYLDIIHKLKGAQRVLVGKSEIRFPIKFKVGLKVVDKDGIPTLKIHVNKVETDEKLVREGLPQYGLPTSIGSIRFKNKVIKAILEDVREFEGNQLVELNLDEFKGTYLERLQFFSDGSGRATALLNFAQESLL